MAKPAEDKLDDETRVLVSVAKRQWERTFDAISDPIAVIGGLYRELGHDFTVEVESRMRLFLSRHPNGRYGNHSYAMASFGLNPVEVDRQFTVYRERFGLERVS